MQGLQGWVSGAVVQAFFPNVGAILKSLVSLGLCFSSFLFGAGWPARGLGLFPQMKCVS